MFGLNPVELVVIGGLAFLFFGWRLPTIARSLGRREPIHARPRPLARDIFIAAVVVEAVLLALVLYTRFVR